MACAPYPGSGAEFECPRIANRFHERFVPPKALIVGTQGGALIVALKVSTHICTLVDRGST
jgi:hypothetical protein